MTNPRPTRRTGIGVALTLAVALVGASSASAQPDLVITALTVQTPARKGPCNTVAVTVRNNGNQVTSVVGIDVFLATYQQNNSTQSRAEKTVMIGGVIQPGGVVNFNFSQVEFVAEGAMTAQALVDSTNKVTESNENNNSRTANVSVSGECYAPAPPPPPPAATCDLKAVFTAPSGATLPGGGTAQFTLGYSNPSNAGPCAAAKVKLMRYTGSTCSGYGSQVGGSSAWQNIPALGPGQSATVSFTEKPTPKRGAHCYKLDYSPRAYNTKTNSHRPQKVVTYN